MKAANHSHWIDRGFRKHAIALYPPRTTGKIAFYNLNGELLVERKYIGLKDRKKKLNAWKEYYAKKEIKVYYHISPNISESALEKIKLPETKIEIII